MLHASPTHPDLGRTIRAGNRSRLALLLLAPLAACDVGSPREGSSPEALAVAKPEPTLPVVEAGPESSPDRVDPERAQTLHEFALSPLANFVETVAGLRPRRTLGPFLSHDFEGASILRPAPLVAVYKDGVTTILRPEVFSKIRLDADALPGAAADLLRGFEPDGRGVDFEIVRVTPEPGIPHLFEVEVQIRLHGHDQYGLLIQTNMTWRIGMSVRERDGQIRIRSLDLTSFVETHTRRILFTDVTEYALGGIPRFASEFLRGATEYHGRMDRLEGDAYLGHEGLSVGDVNGDGLDDLLIAQPGGLPNRLLVRRPDGTAEDVSEGSGIDLLERTQSTLLVDLDADGDQDAVLATGGSIHVGYNDGHGRFDLSRRSLAGAGGTITSLSAADYDLDGDLDLFACVHESNPSEFGFEEGGLANGLWRNDGERRWTDVTAAVGLAGGRQGLSHAAIWEDFDNDGDPDLYVVNDLGRNELHRNENGVFVEVAEEVGAADMEPGTGVAAADLDADGDIDLYVSNMFSAARLRIVAATKGTDAVGHGNRLLANAGDGTFSDATPGSGTAIAGWTWGAGAIDVNNDGLEDLYAPNGFLTNDRDEDL